MILIARPYSRATSKWREARATLSGTALLAQLVEHLHGKEGVDGSSPSEGSAKTLHVGAFAFRSTCRTRSVRWVWSRLWSFRVDGPLSARPDLAQDSRACGSVADVTLQLWLLLPSSGRRRP